MVGYFGPPRARSLGEYTDPLGPRVPAVQVESDGSSEPWLLPIQTAALYGVAVKELKLPLYGYIMNSMVSELW